jgi:hypothetical protein
VARVVAGEGGEHEHGLEAKEFVEARFAVRAEVAEVSVGVEPAAEVGGERGVVAGVGKGVHHAAVEPVEGLQAGERGETGEDGVGGRGRGDGEEMRGELGGEIGRGGGWREDRDGRAGEEAETDG